MRLSINLATKTYLNNRLLNYIFGVVVTLLLFVLCLQVWLIYNNESEKYQIKEDIAKFEKKANKGERIVVSEQDYKQLMTHINFANGVIERKTFNWALLLEKLETVVPEGVTLNAIEPDPKTKGLKISGATLTFSGLRKFMENLEQNGSFTETYLISHTDAKVPGSQKGITFSITCKVGLL